MMCFVCVMLFGVVVLLFVYFVIVWLFLRFVSLLWEMMCDVFELIVFDVCFEEVGDGILFCVVGSVMLFEVSGVEIDFLG